MQCPRIDLVGFFLDFFTFFRLFLDLFSRLFLRIGADVPAMTGHLAWLGLFWILVRFFLNFSYFLDFFLVFFYTFSFCPRIDWAFGSDKVPARWTNNERRRRQETELENVQKVINKNNNKKNTH